MQAIYIYIHIHKIGIYNMYNTFSRSKNVKKNANQQKNLTELTLSGLLSTLVMDTD